mgnify:FL=1|jgi:hypothetical protein
MKRDDEYLRGLLIDFEESDDDIHLVAEYMRMPLEERKKLYHVR